MNEGAVRRLSVRSPTICEGDAGLPFAHSVATVAAHLISARVSSTSRVTRIA